MKVRNEKNNVENKIRSTWSYSDIKNSVGAGLVSAQRGITLIALIITIILMLILAGVALSMLVGKNGLIKTAEVAKKQYTKADIQEMLEVKIAEIQSQKEGEAVLEDLDNISVDGYKIDVGSIGRIITVTKDNQTYSFWVDKDLKITEMNGTISIGQDDEKYKKLQEEYEAFKNNVAKAITDEGVETKETYSNEQIIENISIMARKRYNDGTTIRLVPIQENLSSRYVQTVSIANIDNYQRFTVDDFVIVNKQMTYTRNSDGEDIKTMSKFYNQETGVLTLGKQKSYTNTTDSRWTFWNVYDVYLKVME